MSMDIGVWRLMVGCQGMWVEQAVKDAACHQVGSLSVSSPRGREPIVELLKKATLWMNRFKVSWMSVGMTEGRETSWNYKISKMF